MSVADLLKDAASASLGLDGTVDPLLLSLPGVLSRRHPSVASGNAPASPLSLDLRACLKLRYCRSMPRNDLRRLLRAAYSEMQPRHSTDIPQIYAYHGRSSVIAGSARKGLPGPTLIIVINVRKEHL